MSNISSEYAHVSSEWVGILSSEYATFYWNGYSVIGMGNMSLEYATCHRDGQHVQNVIEVGNISMEWLSCHRDRQHVQNIIVVCTCVIRMGILTSEYATFHWNGYPVIGMGNMSNMSLKNAHVIGMGNMSSEYATCHRDGQHVQNVIEVCTHVIRMANMSSEWATSQRNDILLRCCPPGLPVIMIFYFMRVCFGVAHLCIL